MKDDKVFITKGVYVGIKEGFYLENSKGEKLPITTDDLGDMFEFSLIANYSNSKDKKFRSAIFKYFKAKKEGSKLEMMKAKLDITRLDKLRANESESDNSSLLFSGKAINAIARARTIGDTDAISKKISIDGVNIFAPDGISKIGVGTAKIYRYAVAKFTKNNQRNASKEKIDCHISFDVKDFAAANGIDINSENAMKNFRRKLKQELEKLLLAHVTWTEKVKGKSASFAGMNYIGGYKVNGDNATIEFTPSMAEYLVSLPMLNYPHSLFLIDDRNYNAFVIGEAMCIHYGQDNNIVNHRENRLKVKNLLKYTSFPDYDTLKEKGWGWERNVKEPFENALDALTQCGFLKDWCYCHEGGIELSDSEARNINSYEVFSELLIKFEISDFIDHEARAIEITKKKAEQIKKCNTKKKKQEQPDK